MVAPIMDRETADLQLLLDTFGAEVELSQIASAYCQGGRNIQIATNILLSGLQGSSSGTSSFSTMDETISQSECSELSEELIEKASIEEKSNIVTNKKGTASMGTVAGVLGKEYAKPKFSRNKPGEGYKPPKLRIEEYPEAYETIPVDTMRKDTEEFLFDMLGDGFKLDRKDIQVVLGVCGYDIKTSMDKLLEYIASKLEKNGDASLNEPAQEQPLMKPSDTCKESAGRLVPGPKLSESNMDRHDMERDLLGALFTVPERIEEAPRRTAAAKAYKKPRAYGHSVTGPYVDAPAEFNAPVVTLLGPQEESGDDENEYQNLRRAVKQHWITMKQYYEAAVEAFTYKDEVRAKKLMEKGHVYKELACEADDKSSRVYLGSSDEGVALDLHEFGPKEAIRLLKSQLLVYASIPGMIYLKITVGGDTEGKKDDARRKRYVERLLEKESIQWTEERNGRTLVIRLDEIDPESLSFANKYRE